MREIDYIGKKIEINVCLSPTEFNRLKSFATIPAMR